MVRFRRGNRTHFQLHVHVASPLESKNQRILLIKADEDAAYSSVMTAMDALRSAGLEDIGLITERRPTAVTATREAVT